MLEYERTENGAIRLARMHPETGITLIARAENLRRERTGIHAQVTLGYENSDAIAAPLAYSTFNIWRDEDRTRLANSSHRALGNGEISRAVTAQSLKMFLDDFCRSVWEFQLGIIEVEETAGDPDTPAARFVVDPYVIAGGGTILYGPPKRGKSFTGIGIAVTADAGINSVFGTAARPVPTLYINLERSRESMRARLGRVNRALGLDPHRPLRMIHRRGSTLADIEERVSKAVKEHSLEFVIYDSISRSGKGGMGLDDVANSIMDTLNSFSVAWLALGHTDRAESDHVFGSQMFSAAADMEIAIGTEREEQSTTLGIALRCKSANDVPWPKTRYIAYDFEKEGLVGIRSADPSEFATLASQMMSVKEQVKAAIAQAGGQATTRELAEMVGQKPQNISRILKDTRTFVKLPKNGRQQPYALLTNHHHDDNQMIDGERPEENDNHLSSLLGDDYDDRRDPRRACARCHVLLDVEGDDYDDRRDPRRACARCHVLLDVEGYTTIGEPICRQCWAAYERQQTGS